MGLALLHSSCGRCARSQKHTFVRVYVHPVFRRVLPAELWPLLAAPHEVAQPQVLDAAALLVPDAAVPRPEQHGAALRQEPRAEPAPDEAWAAAQHDVPLLAHDAQAQAHDARLAVRRDARPAARLGAGARASVVPDAAVPGSREPAARQVLHAAWEQHAAWELHAVRPPDAALLLDAAQLLDAAAPAMHEARALVPALRQEQELSEQEPSATLAQQLAEVSPQAWRRHERHAAHALAVHVAAPSAGLLGRDLEQHLVQRLEQPLAHGPAQDLARDSAQRWVLAPESEQQQQAPWRRAARAAALADLPVRLRLAAVHDPAGRNSAARHCHDGRLVDDPAARRLRRASARNRAARLAAEPDDGSVPAGAAG